MINIKTKNFNLDAFNKLLIEKNDLINSIKQELLNKTIIGNEYTGWLDWTNNHVLIEQLNLINQYKNEWFIKGINHVLIIGIGGSSIGTKAIVDICSNPFDENLPKLYFVDSLSTKYNVNLIKYLEDKNWGIVVISKSGTTFETMANFRLFREQLKNQFNKDWVDRTIVITDKKKGVLRNIANEYHLRSLIVPDDIGGRFSTITPVGLFPFALLNIDLHELLLGWDQYLNDFINKEVKDNASVKYALLRYLMKNEYHKDVEVFCTYEKELRSFSEYYKQIFAESEGKHENIIIPTIANYSNDLHSIGQLYQDGPKNFFETTLMYDAIKAKITIPYSSFNNDDNLDNIVGLNLLELNYHLTEAVINAHDEIANIIIEFDKCDTFNVGQLLAFFALSAVFSARLNNVNPFDQNGVEKYKSNLKKLLKK